MHQSRSLLEIPPVTAAYFEDDWVNHARLRGGSFSHGDWINR